MVVQNVSALEKPNYVLLILLLNKHRYMLPVSLSGAYTGIFVCIPWQPVRGVYRYIRVCPLSACQGRIQEGGAQPFWTSQKGALLPIEIGTLNIYFFTNLFSPISLQHDCVNF